MSEETTTETGSDFAARRLRKQGVCRVCKKRYRALRTAKFCSGKCRQKYYRQQRKAAKRAALMTRSVLQQETTT